jgi:hypothetical protein
MRREGKVENLPKWAQSYITQLERRVSLLEARAAVGTEASNTFANPFDDVPIPLGMNTSIRYSPLPRHHEYLDIRPFRDEVLGILIMGWDQLVVKPHGGVNTLSVEVAAR